MTFFRRILKFPVFSAPSGSFAATPGVLGLSGGGGGGGSGSSFGDAPVSKADLP